MREAARGIACEERGDQPLCRGLGVLQQRTVRGKNVVPHHTEHRGSQFPIVAHDRMNELHSLLALRHFAEDVHPVGYPGLGDPGDGGMGGGDHLFEGSPTLLEGAEPDLVADAGLFEEVGDRVFECVRPRPVDAFCPVVVRDLIFEVL